MKPLSVVVLLGATLLAQSGGSLQMTIPETLEKAGTSVTRSIGVPSGLGPDLDYLVARTDLIVRGVPANSRTYLSADQREIYTDYDLPRPQVLFRSKAVVAERPGAAAAIRVTLLGGTMTFNGLTFTSLNESLPGFDTGQEYILLLRQSGPHYVMAEDRFGFGALRVQSDRVQPVVNLKRMTREIEGLTAAEVATLLVAKAARTHRPSR